jgi:feruloyl esterase
MVPALQHCAGGAGADSFGQISAAPPDESPDRNVAAAVVAWVEKGRAPESLIGVRGKLAPPGTTASVTPIERLHCAYPAEPVLRSGADVDRATSYTCRTANRR